MITSVLADVAKTVTAVEVDARLAQKIRENAGKQPNVTVQQADILQMPLPRTPYKVFANIPFSLSSPIVQRLTGATQPPTAIYLIVQEQFARKLLPDNKGYTNQLAITIGAEFAVRIRQRLRPEDFYPRPNVPTVFIEIIRRRAPLVPAGQIVAFRKFIINCFADPRTLWKAPLHSAGLPALVSPSRLTLNQWISLYAYMQDNPQERGLAVIDASSLSGKPAAPVAANEFTSPSVRFVADRLRALLGRRTIALAAPRIGVSKRMVALSAGGQNMLVLVNPVVRGRMIVGQDHTGKPVKLQLTDNMLEAALQEIALLDGAQS